LTGSNVAGSELDFYYYFFDWKIREADCISSRTLVTATIEPGFDLTVSDDVTIASGETTVLTASGGLTYSWSPTTGLSDPLAATTNASPTVTTTYTVSSTDADGCTISAEVTVTVDGQIGVYEEDEDLSFEIFPNPSSGIINIGIGRIDSPYSLEVFTVDGKRVFVGYYQVDQSFMTIDLSRLAKGIYYVTLTSGGLEFQEKVVLN
jgi:hypothetical protein